MHSCKYELNLSFDGHKEDLSRLSSTTQATRRTWGGTCLGKRKKKKKWQGKAGK
jgi:hypothetical protein